jgi:hypothetical protein
MPAATTLVRRTSDPSSFTTRTPLLVGVVDRAFQLGQRETAVKHTAMQIPFFFTWSGVYAGLVSKLLPKYL